MSVQLMSLVFYAALPKDLPYKLDGEPRKLKASTAKLVLLAYADHANDEGEGSYPSYTRLERKTALTPRGIANSIEALKQNDFIAFEQVSKYGTNSYKLNKEKLQSLQKPLRKRDAKTTEPGSVVAKTSTEPRSVPLLNPVQYSTEPRSVESSYTSSTSNGADAPLPLDWKIAHGEPVSEEDLKAEKQRARQDIAHLIATGTGAHAEAVYEIAFAFMEARDITFPKSKVKGQRKAALALVEQGVTADHVKKAVAHLMSINYTCADLFSVERTAVDLANQPVPTPSKPIEYVRADPEPKRNPPPDWAIEKSRQLRARLGRLVGDE